MQLEGSIKQGGVILYTIENLVWAKKKKKKKKERDDSSSNHGRRDSRDGFRDSFGPITRFR